MQPRLVSRLGIGSKSDSPTVRSTSLHRSDLTEGRSPSSGGSPVGVSDRHPQLRALVPPRCRGSRHAAGRGAAPSARVGLRCCGCWSDTRWALHGDLSGGFQLRISAQVTARGPGQGTGGGQGTWGGKEHGDSPAHCSSSCNGSHTPFCSVPYPAPPFHRLEYSSPAIERRRASQASCTSGRATLSRCLYRGSAALPR